MSLGGMTYRDFPTDIEGKGFATKREAEVAAWTAMSERQGDFPKSETVTVTPEAYRAMRDNPIAGAAASDAADETNGFLPEVLQRRGIDSDDVEAARAVWEENFSKAYYDRTGVQLDDAALSLALSNYGSADELFEQTAPSTLRAGQMKVPTVNGDRDVKLVEVPLTGPDDPFIYRKQFDVVDNATGQVIGRTRQDATGAWSGDTEVITDNSGTSVSLQNQYDRRRDALRAMIEQFDAESGGTSTLRSSQMRTGARRGDFNVLVRQALDGSYYYDITTPKMVARPFGARPGMADVPVGLRGNNYPNREMALRAGEDRLDRYEAEGFPSLETERNLPPETDDAGLDVLAMQTLTQREDDPRYMEGESRFTPEEAAAYNDRFLDALIRVAMVPDRTLVAEKERRQAQGSTLRSNQMSVGTSEYVGEVGSKVNTEATITGLRKINGAYGESTLVTMEDPDGNVIKTFTTAAWANDATVGDRVALAATVKKQAEFRGVPETVVSRPKVTVIEKGSGGGATDSFEFRGVTLTPALDDLGNKRFVGPGANAQDGSLPVYVTQYGDEVVIATSNRTGGRYLATVQGNPSTGSRFYNKAALYDAEKRRQELIDFRVEEFRLREQSFKDDLIELEQNEVLPSLRPGTPIRQDEVDRLNALDLAEQIKVNEAVAAYRTRLETEVYPSGGGSTLRSNQMSIGDGTTEDFESLDQTPDGLLDWELGEWNSGNGSAILSLSYATDAKEFFLTRASTDPGGGVRTVSGVLPAYTDPEDVVADLARRAGWDVGGRRRLAEDSDKDVAQFESGDSDALLTLAYDRQSNLWGLTRTSRDPDGGVETAQREFPVGTTPREALTSLAREAGWPIGDRTVLGPDTPNTLGVQGDRVPGSYTQAELNALSDSYLLRLFAQNGDPALRAELVSRGLLAS